MSGIAVGRLTEERKNWRKDHPPGFYARPVKKEDNSTDIMSWETGIPGREGSYVSFKSTWFEQNLIAYLCFRFIRHGLGWWFIQSAHGIS